MVRHDQIDLLPLRLAGGHLHLAAQLFGQLVAIDPGYRRSSPTARLDSFLTSSAYQFVELNAETPAGIAYNEVLVGSPKSDRVPAALLRQASAFAELGDKIDARLILQKLIQEHPSTPEAAREIRALTVLIAVEYFSAAFSKSFSPS